MLLAEALVLRADRHKRLKELATRIENNARVPGGAAPDEDPEVLLEEATRVADELVGLVRRINRTNAATVAGEDEGATVSDLIAERDRARDMAKLLRGAAQAGTRGTGRGWGSREADATKAAVDVPALQREADRWAVRYRELDVRLQQLNWASELLE